MEFGSEMVLFVPPEMEEVRVAKPKTRGVSAASAQAASSGRGLSAGATVGSLSSVRTADGGVTALLDILDSAGQEEYSAMRDQYYRTGEGFLLVFSLNSRSSLDEALMVYEQCCRVKDSDNIAAVLVGNKCDLVDQRQVTCEEGVATAERLGIPYFETSAKEAINVEQAFQTIAKNALQQEAEAEL